MVENTANLQLYTDFYQRLQKIPIFLKLPKIIATNSTKNNLPFTDL
jgi:hypothetical protein